MRVVEWFGGIGAATTAIKRLGINYELIDYVELDKNAVKSYNLLNGTNFETKDINSVNVNGYGEVDLLIAGWPCQDLSIAGKQKGLVESDRSSLIWTTINKIGDMEKRPKVILLENVKGLLGKKHKEGFEVIKKSFRELGYIWSHKLLNSKFFGVPQNRERVYCVLTRDTRFNWEWSDKFDKLLSKGIDIIDWSVEWNKAEKYSIIGKYAYINASEKQVKEKSSFKRYWDINWEYIGATTASNSTKVFTKYGSDMLYRSLTAKECWKLMGFNDKEFNKVRGHISDSQLSKQAGNSIVVNVLIEIFRNIIKMCYNIYREVI